MSRVRFLEDKQGNFLDKTRKKLMLEWPDIAEGCRVHQRTLFDWRRNKYQMNHAALQLLREKYGIPLPKIEVLPDTWHLKASARLGARKRYELYGNPGTFEGRRKGGAASSLKFRNNPKLASKSGFILRKHIVRPPQSALLAEFLGIILGDGSITDGQVRIYANRKTDGDYAHFIKKIAARLFNVDITMAAREPNCLELAISSRDLVDFLLDCGLKKGDKISSGVDVPGWVLDNKEFSKGCLRGLMDTDGGIFFHKHTTKGIRYRHMGLCFTSHSKPLLNSVCKMISNFSIKCKSDGRRHLMIYDRNEVRKYMQIIGSHNGKHIRRFRSYKSSRV